MKTFLNIAAFATVAFFCGCDKTLVPYELTIDQNTSACEIAKGGKLTIQLKGNPTTGYLWAIVEDGTPIIKFLKEQYDATNPQLLGSGGISNFIFEAQLRGATKIKFNYGRPWEMKPEKSAEFSVVVR